MPEPPFDVPADDPSGDRRRGASVYVHRLGTVEERSERNERDIRQLTQTVQRWIDTAPLRFVTKDEQAAKTDHLWTRPMILLIAANTLVILLTAFGVISHG